MRKFIIVKTYCDRKDIADKILHICRDRSEIAEMSEQARTYVRTHYNWKYIAKLYEQQYRKVLE